MSLRFYYRPNWRSGDPAIEFTGNGQTKGVRLYTFDMTEYAEEGSVATSRYLVDDPDGSYDFPPLTRIWAVESEVASSSNTYVHHGYIADRTIRRGTSPLTSAARMWEVSVADENSVLSRRVLSSTDANRPAETDVARVQWLANVADGQGLIDDTQYLSTADPVSMDAVDYRGQTGLEVLNDCAQASGKNFFAYFNQSLGTGLWYGAEDLAVYNSSIRLTNVLARISEADNVYAIGDGENTQLVRDPSRIVSSVWYQYAAGSVYVRNQAMFEQIGLRDQVHASLNVKTQARATSRANRYLADNDSEDDRITTTVRLPASKVTWLKAGMRVRFQATHLPGYESETWLRVYRCSVAQDSEETYLLTLEMGTNSIPPSPVAEPATTTILSATLSIGSAAHLGLPSDRTIHYASQVGASLPALTIGKEYRLVAHVVNTLDLDGCLAPFWHYDSMNAPGMSIWNTAEGPNKITGGAGYTVTTPADDATFNYSNGAEWTINAPVKSAGTAPNDSYAPGAVLTGGWSRFDGPAVTETDISITATGISGFCGFLWVVNAQLQERDA